ncbi:PspC domain-containing protein [bacterium RCC_150]
MNENSMNPEESGQPGETGQPGQPGLPNEPQQEPGQPGRPAHTAPAPQQNFFGWIRSQGISRGQDRWIGGVASGIAHRFGIDPLIVRGIFIILTLFAGIGILLYGVGWALLPEPDGRIHAQEAGAGRWSAGMTGAVIATAIGLPSLGHGFWGWGWNGVPGLFWTLFWVGGLIYLIYFLVQRNRARNGIRDTATAYSTSYEGARAAYGPMPPSGTGYSPPPTTGQYRAGQYGTAGYARPPRPQRQGPGTAIVAVSAGAALLAGGTLKLLDAGNVVHLGDATNAVAWASGAGILGLGILVAGLRGRSSGLLGFLAIVTLVVGGIFNIAPHADRLGLRDAQWNPVSIDDARKGYDITGGNGTVDLTKLNLTAPLASDVVIPMDVTASNIKLLIPANVPVEVQADMTFANLKQDGSSFSESSQGNRNDYNNDKPGAKLIVKLDGTFSNVTVQEGN